MHKKIILLLLASVLLVFQCACSKKPVDSEVDIQEKSEQQIIPTEISGNNEASSSDFIIDYNDENSEEMSTVINEPQVIAVEDESAETDINEEPLQGAGIYYLSGLGYDGEGALGPKTLSLFDYTLDKTYLFLFDNGTGEMGMEDSDGGADVKKIIWNNEKIVADGEELNFERRGNDIIIYFRESAFRIFTLKNAESTVDPIALFEELGYLWDEDFKNLLELSSGE